MTLKQSLWLGFGVAMVGILLLLQVRSESPLVTISRTHHDTTTVYVRHVDTVSVKVADIATALDTTIYIQCPGVATKVIHYPKPIDWSREVDPDGKRIVVYTESNPDFAVFAMPGNTTCIVGRNKP